MKIENRSQYGTQQVTEIVAWVHRQFVRNFPDIDQDLDVTIVKKTGGAYSGSYKRIWFDNEKHVKHHAKIRVCVGDPTRFPTDTSRYTWKRGKIKRGGMTYTFKTRGKRQGYGGKGSPIIKMKNWQEAMVAVTAHEMTHHIQHELFLPASEVHAEKVALLTLNLFRGLQKKF